MSADRTRLIIVFVLTLGAGVAAGLLGAKLPWMHGNVETKPTEKTWLVQELNLSPQQSEQMRQIWEGVRDKTRQSTDDASRAREKRDLEIQELVPADKLEEYRAANQAYDSAVAKLKAEREEEFNRAVKRTKEMLTPAQVEKYNAILKERLETGGASHQDSADKSRGGGVVPQGSPS